MPYAKAKPESSTSHETSAVKLASSNALSASVSVRSGKPWLFSENTSNSRLLDVWVGQLIGLRPSKPDVCNRALNIAHKPESIVDCASDLLLRAEVAFRFRGTVDSIVAVLEQDVFYGPVRLDPSIGATRSPLKIQAR